MSTSVRGRQARIAQVRDPTFPAALRGYEREAVDAYVQRVRGVISELEASGSPEAAIKRALDQVGEETSAILQRAQQTANEITERSRASADDRVREAEREARALREDAEDRVRELEADYGAIWAQRDRLLDQVRELAERLLATADEAGERFPAEEDELTAQGAGENTATLPAVDAAPAPLAEGSAGSTAPEPQEGEPEPADPEAEPSPGEEIDFVQSPDEDGEAAYEERTEANRQEGQRSP